MASADRQQIIETNRSLRTIKNELESLLEKGIIDGDAFDGIHALLPAEASLSSSTTAAAPSVRTTAAAVAAKITPPTTSLANLNINKIPPPSYSSTGPPSLPARATPAAPAKRPSIGRAKALYKYAGADARDVSFEKDDTIEVLEHMNADWWMGRNTRTGQEGIFPRNYVEPEKAGGGWRDEKAPVPYQPPATQQPVSSYPEPPRQSNPYNANAVAEHGGDGRANEAGKKFGKKLGNAAIFGAGATLGSKIVGSIF